MSKIKDIQNLPSTSSSHTSRLFKRNLSALKREAVYCTAEPGTEEWKSYQSVRLKSLRNLKYEKDSARILAQINSKANEGGASPNNNNSTILIKKPNPSGAVNPSPTLQTILKKKKKPSSSSRATTPAPTAATSTSESVTWKVPLEHLPNIKKKKSKKSPGDGGTVTKQKGKPAAGGVNVVADPHRSRPSSRPTTGQLQAWTNGLPSSTTFDQQRATSSGKMSKKVVLPGRKKSSEYIRPAQRKPPKFPELDVCNVFPGTPEWDEYWETFNGKISDYYKAMDNYGKGIEEFSKDLNLYKEQLQRITLHDNAFQIQLGMRPMVHQPPILKELLKPDSMRIVGEWMVKTIGSGGDLPRMFLTSFDHHGFRLEIQLKEVEDEETVGKRIKFDKELNLMLIQLGEGHEVHIGAMGKTNVEDQLKIGVPLAHAGYLVIRTLKGP